MAKETKEAVTTQEGPPAPAMAIAEESTLRVLAQQITDLHDVEFAIIKSGNQDECGVLVLPQGRRAIDVTPFLEAQREYPRRIRGRAKLMTPESFIAHVNRFKGKTTAVFADVLSKPPRLLARYDYHDRDTPRWQEHGASYSFPESEEWKAWEAQNRKLMSIDEFAYFLEQRVVDVLHPQQVEDTEIERVRSTLEMDWATPQQLLQLSKNFSVHTESRLTEVSDVQGGKKNFSFQERDVDAEGKSVTMPGGFIIQVPVFEGTTPWIIPVMLRYRKENGRAKFFYEIYRMDMHKLASMRDTCKSIEDKTGVPLFYGRPEASLSAAPQKTAPASDED